MLGPASRGASLLAGAVAAAATAIMNSGNVKKMFSTHVQGTDPSEWFTIDVECDDDSPCQRACEEHYSTFGFCGTDYFCVCEAVEEGAKDKAKTGKRGVKRDTHEQYYDEFTAQSDEIWAKKMREIKRVPRPQVQEAEEALLTDGIAIKTDSQQRKDYEIARFKSTPEYQWLRVKAGYAPNENAESEIMNVEDEEVLKPMTSKERMEIAERLEDRKQASIARFKQTPEYKFVKRKAGVQSEEGAESLTNAKEGKKELVDSAEQWQWLNRKVQSRSNEISH